MHPDQAALYAKIDLYEDALKAIVAQGKAYDSECTYIARTALYRAKTNKQITFHKEAANGKKKA